MSDTPRTDAEASIPVPGQFKVRAEFARELERENAVLRETVNDLLQNHDKVYAHERWACVEQAAQRARTVLADL